MVSQLLVLEKSFLFTLPVTYNRITCPQIGCMPQSLTGRRNEISEFMFNLIISETIRLYKHSSFKLHNIKLLFYGTQFCMVRWVSLCNFPLVVTSLFNSDSHLSLLLLQVKFKFTNSKFVDHHTRDMTLRKISCCCVKPKL